MKILGICCSPRKGQATFRAMEICLEAARAYNDAITTQLIELADRDVRPCLACGECKTGLTCPIEDDFASLVPILSDPDVAGMVVEVYSSRIGQAAALRRTVPPLAAASGATMSDLVLTAPASPRVDDV